MARRMMPADRLERLQGLDLKDSGHGFDVFGANEEWIAFAAGTMRLPYEKWFRVSSYGIDNIPSEGPAVLACNHSGTLPFDAMMIWKDVLERADPPRLLRPVLDHFVPLLPGVGTFFTRSGAVGGSRANVRALLEADALLLIFPEGTEGIGKPFSERYKLQTWRVGHCELALRYQAPVVPMAVIGAEEQMPQLARIKAAAKVFGAPYIPVPASLVPLPVHYHIHYGAPVALHEIFGTECADDPEVLRAAADLIKAEVAKLIDYGLKSRRGIF